jgi:hypothetical protein
MRRFLASLVIVGLSILMGCSSGSTPTQRKLSDDEIKDLMKQGKGEAKKERGNRPPGADPGMKFDGGAGPVTPR